MRGFAASEVGHAFTRARDLCRQVEDTPQLCNILLSLHAFYQAQGDHQTSRELVEQSLAPAQRLHEPGRIMRGHGNLGTILYWLGEIVPARLHLEQALTILGPYPTLIPGQDPRVLPLGYMAQTLWRLGYPAQALTWSHEMLILTQERQYVISPARALHYATLLHQLRREVHATQERAEAALALSTEHGFGQWWGDVTFQRGWALAAQGQHEEGIAQMQQGLAAKRATGAVLGLSEYLVRLAEMYGWLGQAEAGMPLLVEALAHVNTTGERHFAAEGYRIQGELLLRQAVPDALQAEACFQQARSWELWRDRL